MSENGQIELCPHQGCGFACCSFASENYIVLYPGELEEAQESGQSVGHLEIVSDDLGGHKAICRANETATCDGGYKPLDCKSYPFFPTIDEPSGQVQLGLKGQKCPLQEIHLAGHQKWVLGRWQSLIDSAPRMMDWIRKTRLVGYIRWPEADPKN